MRAEANADVTYVKWIVTASRWPHKNGMVGVDPAQR